jgi:hypothetical protein
MQQRAVHVKTRARAFSGRMELDSGRTTAAFHGCGSAVGADGAPADAWPSSHAVVT